MQIRLGTRKSPLALAQAGHIRDRLQAAHIGLSVELVHIVTSGDKFLDQPLADIGGKGLFTKEIEEALLTGGIDLAVHSVKDMQTVLPEGLVIGCVPEREDPRDALIGAASFADLPKEATFGTSSLRRAAQALMLRPDLKIVPLRGNVETRIKKVNSGEIGATLLAVAGLKRLGITVPSSVLAVDEFIPAVGQGALGIECRAGDQLILDLLAPLNHALTFAAIACERAFLKALDGSCRTPIAGYASISPSPQGGDGRGGGILHFDGLLAEPDGKRHWRIHKDGHVKDAEAIGKTAGEEVKARR